MLPSCTNNESNKSLNVAHTVDITTSDYVVLAEKALTYQADMDLESWGGMLADDVQFLPAHQAKPITGRKNVVSYWQQMAESKVVRKLRLTDFTHFPIKTSKPLSIYGPVGVYVCSTCRCEVVFLDGRKHSNRWNVYCHFNTKKQIDRLIEMAPSYELIGD